MIQSFLEGILKLEQRPKLDPPLVAHLGERWNAWHSAIQLLEQQSEELNGDELESVYTSLSELYRLLNEPDLQVGLWKKRGKLPETITGLTLEQSGDLLGAQEVFCEVSSSCPKECGRH